MGVSYNPKTVTDGLVFCLDAANKRSYPGSGTVWTDLSKNKNNGTLTNGPTFDSANGGSIVFDGSDDYVNVITNASLDIRSDITLTAWGYRYSTNTFPYFINKSSSNDTVQYLLGWNNPENIAFYSMGIAASTTASSIGVALNEWNYFVGTRIGNQVTLYVNAEIVNSTSAAPILSHVSSADVRIGTLGWAGSSWNGKIGPLCIYNQGLTSEQVRQNYNVTKGRFQ